MHTAQSLYIGTTQKPAWCALHSKEKTLDIAEGLDVVAEDGVSIKYLAHKNFRYSLIWIHLVIKGDSNPNDKYVLSVRALWTMNFDTSIIKIGWKMGKLWAFKEFNMTNI